jgi:hypothetical protein
MPRLAALSNQRLSNQVGVSLYVNHITPGLGPKSLSRSFTIFYTFMQPLRLNFLHMKLIAIILMLFILTSCAATLTVPAPTAQITVTSVTRDDCRRGGWERLRRADGSRFRNQGACVSYFSGR